MRALLNRMITRSGGLLAALIAILALTFYLEAAPAKEKAPGGGGGGAFRGGGGGGMRGGGGGPGGGGMGIRGGSVARPPKMPSIGGGGGAVQVPRLNPGAGSIDRSPMKPPSFGSPPSNKVPRSGGGGNWGGGGHGGGGWHDGDGWRHRRRHDDDDYYFYFGYYPWYRPYFAPYYYYYDYYPYYAYPEVVTTVPVYPEVIVPEPNYYPPGRYYPENKYYEPSQPPAGGPTQGIGWDFLRTGQPEQALSAFKMEAGDNPGAGTPLIGQALAYLEIEHPIDAAKFFNHALQLDPNSLTQIRLETSLRSKLESRASKIAGAPTPNPENDALNLACLNYLLGYQEAAKMEAEKAGQYERNASAIGNLRPLIDAMSPPQAGAAG